jgi:hypothetical protein
MTRQSSVLTLFGLLILTVSSGVLSSSLPLQTSTTAVFAQTSSSLADEIIDETLQGQDSSADDNILEDSNEFGGEDAAIEQDNEEDQDSANVGLQDEDATQEQEQGQDAANTNVDSDVQEGEQVEPPLPPTQPPTEPPTEPPGPPLPPPEEDTTPPTLIVPEGIVVEATSAEGAQVKFIVTAHDNVDGTAILDDLIQDNVGGSIIISCDPPTGSMFPVGSTEVECTATDEAGNTATASFTVTVNPITVTCQGETATILGTPGDDFFLLGTEGPDVIAALGGSDLVFGLGGDDIICGNEGNDTLIGGISLLNPANSGDDQIDGGEGDDEMRGGDGNNLMDGGPGNDGVFGGIHVDTLSGGAGNDQVIGSDQLFGGDGGDTLFGGDGDDIVSGFEGNDDMSGGPGNDFIFGDEGDDTLDSVDGVVNNDNLFGGPDTTTGDICTSDPDTEFTCEF